MGDSSKQMSRKRRKTRNYDISGIIEVINITKGRRKTTIINLNEKPIVPNLQISGSIVQKSPIYKQDVSEASQKEDLHSSGSLHEGQNPLHSL
jgi:hypothetical protein